MPTPAAQRARQGFCERLTGETPWRCVVCNVAVRPGEGDPCKCTEAIEDEQAKGDEAKPDS
jgi:hypothetical protein